jgi:hypothetical protein
MLLSGYRIRPSRLGNDLDPYPTIMCAVSILGTAEQWTMAGHEDQMLPPRDLRRQEARLPPPV